MNLTKAWKMLLLLCLAELMGMTVWYSASAVTPALRAEWGLTDGQMATLVMSVQLGFVAGTLFLAATNLADVVKTRKVLAISALLAAAVNAAFVPLGRNMVAGTTLRFFTGFFLAGIYPPGMKMIAGWFKAARGLAIGALVGALTVGTALPHLVGALLRARWQLAIYTSSVLALLAALLIVLFMTEGPYEVQASKFNFKYVFTVWQDRPTRLAYFGYFGHMWELYAMWTWIPAFFLSFLDRQADAPPYSAGVAAFLVIAAGGVGCVLYGIWADRIGRSISTITAMGVSGLCCFLVGFLQHLSPNWMLAVCLLWGVTVVADSAQFSAAASELSAPEYLGTVLTLQTSIGFLITMFSIRLVPLLKGLGGWGLAFSILGLGPILGILSMASLYRLPEAVRMANGNR